MDITNKDASLPDWKGIGLGAVEYGQKQVDDDTAFVLKGRINKSFAKDGNDVGFILVKEGVNLYHSIQKVIASENGWSTVTTSFSSEMVIVPAKLRNIAPYIIADLSPKEVQKGKYKILYYVIENTHYYLSQMEQLLSDVTTSSISGESIAPSITFDGSSHGLKVLDLKLIRERVPGQDQTVKILENSKIEYSVNDQIQQLPNLQSALLFIQKGTIWRTTVIESLFKELQKSNGNASITNDGTIALISDLSKPLGQSGIDFFNRAADYEYFACLFSKENNRLMFYT
ncbi:hypothetical protein [Cardinium endosymbiont of Dermatophagoides farinae]|uniref:hypothetical protein n=1 Tax=Cardinium endosymbiont of Dermatophagoides farinae TaxID=2597823 RepID=UPI0011823C1A|nr:hypothetical protein [Cardinium endosymbiont of Dermatophagoides farinae]TSJ80874.1 hypothetical protein FPG78_02340 [Cardinium endosymbiont of Dermatophagoides farinae]